jgi:hypothetical protein
VLFGSVTNTGTDPISPVRVVARWPVGDEVYNAMAKVADPQGGALAELAPGASADVLVVIDDASVANSVQDIVPTFEAS